MQNPNSENPQRKSYKDKFLEAMDVVQREVQWEENFREKYQKKFRDEFSLQATRLFEVFEREPNLFPKGLNDALDKLASKIISQLEREMNDEADKVAESYREKLQKIEAQFSQDLSEIVSRAKRLANERN